MENCLQKINGKKKYAINKWTLLITVVLPLYSIISGANDFLDQGQDHPHALENGVNAWSEGNYTLAYKLLYPLSVQKNKVAQYIIGLMYFRGKIVRKDYKESIKYFSLSAEQGYARAQHKLGNIYVSDLLGKPDYRKAIKWFRLASEQGYAPSQYFLATLYENGDGIEQDYVRAYMWFSLASKKNIIAGDERDRIIRKMTPYEITNAQNMAQDCERKSYKQCD